MNEFKHLPKCTEEYKQQQIQQVLEADVIYEWECDLVQRLRYIQPCVMGAMCLLALLVVDGYEKYFIFLPVMAIMMPVSYFLFQASERQQGQLTEHGIIVSTVELVPEVFYAATRYAAYVGIVVCLLAVIFVGPLAFVGAGAGALMAFKMTGFNNDPKVKVFPFLKTLKYTIWTDFENPSFENGVNSVSFKNMDLMPRENDDGDDLYGELRRFHCVVYSCNKEQQKVIESCLKGVISTESDDEYMSKIKREKNSADKISTS
ncbi:hypothetical protein KDD30_23940 (plasmid) [Photobacterium sp. GJ3]|uniref:hypothetical protein n=1 Tax=Photobacterium sp. GJ3 TaxID=2829502 RepID=UPI001B8CFFB3|nr:hypothetical protein [Photobacterium sp. GJ3]QUJ69770.1 hypothetical protein KDD30_23940 [Photobacterium sp. GJ3]